MGKLHKNQSGFGTVEIILIVIIIGLLGAVGWFVYDRNHNKATPSPAGTTTTTASTATKPVDPYADWQTITNPNGTWASVKIPKTWQHIVCDGGSYIGVGKDKNNVGICNSDAIAEIGFTSSAIKDAGPSPTKASTDKTFTDDTVTVDGIVGHKYTEVVKTGSGIMNAGFTYTTYIFSSNGRVYIAVYAQNETGDSSSEIAIVNQIIHTWKF